jgi:hypothetical protein
MAEFLDHANSFMPQDNRPGQRDFPMPEVNVRSANPGELDAEDNLFRTRRWDSSFPVLYRLVRVYEHRTSHIAANH